MSADDVFMYDRRSRRWSMPRDKFIRSAVPQILSDAWNDHESLHDAILEITDLGIFEELEEAFKRLVDLAPDKAEYWLLAASHRGVLNKIDDMERLVAHAEGTFGESAMSVYLRGVIAKERGEEAKANRLVADALRLDPNHRPALHWMLDLAENSRGEDGVEAVLLELAEGRGAWLACAELGMMKCAQAKVQQAIRWFSQAIASQPPTGDLLRIIATSLYDCRRLEDLVSLIAPHVQFPRDDSTVGRILAESYLTLGRDEDCEQVLRQLLKPRITPHRNWAEQVRSQLRARKTRKAN